MILSCFQGSGLGRRSEWMSRVGEDFYRDAGAKVEDEGGEGAVGMGMGGAGQIEKVARSIEAFEEAPGWKRAEEEDVEEMWREDQEWRDAPIEVWCGNKKMKDIGDEKATGNNRNGGEWDSMHERGRDGRCQGVVREQHTTATFQIGHGVLVLEGVRMYIQRAFEASGRRLHGYPFIRVYQDIYYRDRLLGSIARGAAGTNKRETGERTAITRAIGEERVIVPDSRSGGGFCVSVETQTPNQLAGLSTARLHIATNNKTQTRLIPQSGYESDVVLSLIEWQLSTQEPVTAPAVLLDS
ncbi:hypothetical protein F4604DRAFT_1691473 [Suillus subluteus]|nr:hypothetical protein F4604DRAFT_1691473 [Suillus subluteus]